MKDAKKVAGALLCLFQRLQEAPKLPKGESWRDPRWPGWEDFGDEIWQKKAVYVLWNEQQQKPVYVGEGLFGARIWTHFNDPKKPWTHVQFVQDPQIAEDRCEAQRMRRLVERFAIAVLEPTGNVA